MSDPKRAIVDLDVILHRALRTKAAATGTSISDLIDDAIRRALTEDARDLAAFQARRKTKRLSLNGVVDILKERGML